MAYWVCFSQATIQESHISLDTYPYDDPNPTPIVVDNPKIVPYHKFNGYSHTSQKKDWKLITLENDHIKVWVLPEIGGKVWGAIEKTTGEEFIYRNEVVKFRNIAMRGPWTSGGIEFNFGIIGHHPSTAAPVDYVTKDNGDGSVSCIVGSVDLPSNTIWRVEIKLEADKAYFETLASWYNASDLPQSYYNWMTAAAFATDDHEFIIPGNQYLEHGGNPNPWPMDTEGRDLSFYRNNNFGPSKSYHIVGDKRNFFGGYYHDKNFGYGHWGDHVEIPGQKLWLWDLSRSGGIWEDLLTDSDGQYIEFQAGRLLNQYFPEDTNPIGQMGFDPMVFDQWRELWFPFKKIGGMVEVSEHAVLNHEKKEVAQYIGVNALQPIRDTLRIRSNGAILLEQALDLGTMEVYETTLALPQDQPLEVILGDQKLYYRSDSNASLLKRDFQPSKSTLSVSQTLLKEAKDALHYREYKTAYSTLDSLLKVDALHMEGLGLMADLQYRMGRYQKSLESAQKILQIATYDAQANYWAGQAYRALGDTNNALETLGWAARDIKYRAAAYTQMAELCVSQGLYAQAQQYATKALRFGADNLRAHYVELVTSRLLQQNERNEKCYQEILKIDPLDHFVSVEKGLMAHGQPNIPVIHNEYPNETLLDIALRYKKYGLPQTAADVLKSIAQPDAKILLWQAYIADNGNAITKSLAQPINFVFPYRRETLKALLWASGHTDHWKLKYYTAHNLWALGQKEPALKMLKECGQSPDSYIFYLFRANALAQTEPGQSEMDFEKALALNPKKADVREGYIKFLLDQKNPSKAYVLAKKSVAKFRGNYSLELLKAKSELALHKYRDCIKTLEKTNILPFEGASESRRIYELAHLGEALQYIRTAKWNDALAVLKNAKKWPENIGVGRPFDPEERITDYLLGWTYQKMGNHTKAQFHFKKVRDYTLTQKDNTGIQVVTGYWAMQQLGETIDWSAQQWDRYDAKVRQSLQQWARNRKMVPMTPLSDHPYFNVLQQIVTLTP
ncbi:MAG: DUF5107 domain-containing protein [Flavobacteriaceae bacterium]